MGVWRLRSGGDGLNTPSNTVLTHTNKAILICNSKQATDFIRF